MKDLKSIFQIQSEQEFLFHALETFHYQYQNVEVYRKFVDYLGKNPSEVTSLDQIPFLPIELFKTHTVRAEGTSDSFYFESSGTTQMIRSKHYINDLGLYEKSIEKSFEKFIGPAEDYIFLGLLPSYLEKKNSSLIYMVDHLMKLSNKKENGYFLYDHERLLEVLKETRKDRVILFGVSFALLDFIEAHPEIKDLDLSNLLLIETGGMKGRKEEITKDELLKELSEGFPKGRIYSEYSMTELLSQAYSVENNWYECPWWMKVMVRSLEDPFQYLPEARTGAVNIIDLANRHSCAFLATQDLGKMSQNKFQVLGRIDHSDVRGCSLLVS